MAMFTVTNQLTGARVDVHRLDANTFEVELVDVDLHAYVCATFGSALDAINYAIEHA